MLLTEFMSEPFVQNTLVGVTVHVIAVIGNRFGKKPRRKDMYIQLEPLLSGIELGDNEKQIIVEFINRDQVQNYLYTFISYRSVKFENETLEMNISTPDFIDKMVIALDEYALNTHSMKIDKTMLEAYFVNMLNVIEHRIVDNMTDDQRVFYNCLSNIEAILNDIKVISMLSQDDSSVSTYDFGKYIRAVKKHHNSTHVHGIDRIALDKFYIFPDLSIYKKEDPIDSHDLASWKHIFNHSNIVSLIGGPGYGKTTFVKSMIQSYEKLSGFNSKSLIPIYCDLKNYFSFKGDEASYSMPSFIHDSMIMQTGISKTELRLDNVRRLLDNGNCLILFDALDEVAIEQRESLQTMIISFFEEVNPNNKVIITSRAYDFIPHTDFIVEINKLSNTQTKEYLKKMAALKNFNFTKKDIAPFLEQSNRLINSNFLTSFLLLSLLVSVYKAEQELPTTKNMLYKKCVEHIVRNRERAKTKGKYDFKTIAYILNREYTFEELALLGFPNNQNVQEEAILEHLSSKYKSKYGCEMEAYNAVEEFLRFCSERTDFYVKGTIDNSYKYFHRSMYDYYLSKNILNKQNSHREVFDKLKEISRDSEVHDLLIEILFSDQYDRYLDFVEWLLSKFESELVGSEIEYSILKCYVILLRNITEIDFQKKYYYLIVEHILASRGEMDTATAVSSFLKSNNLNKKFMSDFCLKYPKAYYSSLVFYLLWSSMNNHKKNIFKHVSYEFFDSNFEYFFVFKYSTPIRSNLLEFEEICSYLIEIDPLTSKFTDHIRIIYEVLKDRISDETYYSATNLAEKISKKIKNVPILEL